jgi:hypothetical protein
MDPLTTTLRRVRRRLLAVRALEAGLAGAVVAAVPALAMTVLRILVPRLLPPLLAHPASALALLPCGFLAAFLVRLAVGVSLHQAARAADRAAGLDDRLATALEVLEREGLSAASPGDAVSAEGSSTVISTEGRRPERRDLAVGLSAPVGVPSRLLADACRAAERVDPRTLPLAATLGRRGRTALVAAVLLAALAMVPSLAGPPVDRPSAERAAGALAPLAEEESLAPAVRQAVRRAVEELRRAGARHRDAEQGTEAVYRAAADARRARERVRRTLASAETQDLRAMSGAAVEGDAAGAESAAADLGARLTAGGSGSRMRPEDRERLGDTLDAAVPQAKEGGLADLERALADAADAVRSDGAPDEPAASLGRLAKTMVRVLGPAGEAAVADAVDTVDRARRAMGLAAASETAVATGQGEGAGVSEPAENGSGGPRETAGEVTAGDGTSVTTVPDGVRPEDRDVVRRYFGG